MAFCVFHYFSAALGLQSTAWILVPDAPGPFSVLYLLHGKSDDHTIWCRRSALERHLEKWPSLMVVMPFGGLSFYCNATGGPAYEDSIIKDLIPQIDRTFHTRPERTGRAVGGLSMGGYGALMLALRHPDIFASAHSHSGALDFGHGWYSDIPDLTRILGDDPTKTGGPNDIYRLATECPNPPALRIDCGVGDFLLAQNQSFHAHLKAARIPHEYQEFPGAHDWEYWDLHIEEALAFHSRNLAANP